MEAAKDSRVPTLSAVPPKKEAIRSKARTDTGSGSFGLSSETVTVSGTVSTNIIPISKNKRTPAGKITFAYRFRKPAHMPDFFFFCGFFFFSRAASNPYPHALQRLLPRGETAPHVGHLIPTETPQCMQ
ncbi:unknown [Clostridium sp. CAG:448]|nr:unknown [Clostridium sp. CAG:448]